ncbi:MAG: hypothetical protein KDM64_20275, partial [Verrucomicrobiae bacterium]|nr:hypothetical protein [Verrucomicrobiae bacterium]
RPFDELPLRRVPEVRLRGRPTIEGSRLYVTNRAYGDFTVVNIADPESPRLIANTILPGNPGRAVVTRHGILVPNGYEGLQLFRKPEE